MTKELSEQQINQYNSKHRENRDIDIFIGICIGMLCDGHVNIHELNFLAEWIEKNPHVRDKYPVSIMAKGLSKWLADGEIDDSEEVELLTLLNNIANGETENDELFCHPEPEIFFNNTQFVLTGTFCCVRSELEKVLIAVGATISKKDITHKTDYLVIGETGSDNWRHSGAGTKIIKAFSFRDAGHKIKIIREKLLLDSINNYLEKNKAAT